MLDLATVTHVRFAVLAADYRTRSRNLELPPKIAEDFGWVADHLERAAVTPHAELEGMYDTMVAGRPPGRGDFARVQAAQIIDEYLMDLEAIAKRKKEKL